MTIKFRFSMALAMVMIPMTLRAANPETVVVIVPVADVWSAPASDPDFLKPEQRETQLLFGEKVLIHASSGEWLNIEATEQPEFTHHNRWEGYPGWVMKNDIGIFTNPLGSRKAVAEAAALFQGRPYLWGGLANGLDCSGLVHLSYRLNGITIPRDAHEQWMKAKPIKRAGLKPADLIFSAKADNPKKITHVALYAGNGQIIEAPQTGMLVRKISFKDKYGKELEEVESGDRVGDRIVYFGSFLQTGSPARTRGG